MNLARHLDSLFVLLAAQGHHEDGNLIVDAAHDRVGRRLNQLTVVIQCARQSLGKENG
jgi:hypothetical protein